MLPLTASKTSCFWFIITFLFSHSSFELLFGMELQPLPQLRSNVVCSKSPFTRLPKELLVSILGFLSEEDVTNFAGLCKAHTEDSVKNAIEKDRKKRKEDSVEYLQHLICSERVAKFGAEVCLDLSNAGLSTIAGIDECTASIDNAVKNHPFYQYQGNEKVTILDLSGNQLTKLNISYLMHVFRNLRIISAENNKIKSVCFPKRIIDEKIDLSNNPLERFDFKGAVFRSCRSTIKFDEDRDIVGKERLQNWQGPCIVCCLAFWSCPFIACVVCCKDEGGVCYSWVDGCKFFWSEVLR